MPLLKGTNRTCLFELFLSKKIFFSRQFGLFPSGICRMGTQYSCEVELCFQGRYEAHPSKDGQAIA